MRNELAHWILVSDVFESEGSSSAPRLQGGKCLRVNEDVRLASA